MFFKANNIIVRQLVMLLVASLVLMACAPENIQQQPQQNSQSESSTPVEESMETSKEESAINLVNYEEENDFFSIQHPEDWSIEAPIDLDSQTPVNIWQFRGEQLSPQFVENVTLGRYITPTISNDISLENWFELVDNNEFEFERLRMESTEIDGRDAYTTHTRYRPPERDAYATYMRCQNRVWFLQALDIDLESTKIEEIYESMLDSLVLSCDE